MQPPPRKGNYAKFLKSLHSEQLGKLSIKNTYECELLEDIRNFTKQRSAIEKSYAEALLKLSSVYLNKKIPNIPDIKLEGGEERWNMWNVWRTVLEENEKLARARLAAVEVFSQSIADDAKVLRSHKLQHARKCVDQLAVVQKELQTTVQDVDRHKKLYFDEEVSAHDVRDKAKDIEEKLKKKKGSFFTSITSLQKNSAKFSSKREICDQRSTGARNDYLLSLAAANSHQTRYFVVDLQTTMLTMESNVFERVQEYLTLIGRTELLTCSATQTSFTRIRDQANKLTREYNLQCCYLFFPVLKQHIQYEYEPCCDDPIDKITVPDPNGPTGSAVMKEAKRWATRIGRETINIRESTRKLHALYNLRDSGQRVDPNDQNGPDLDTKIDELRQVIRKSETAKIKAEARIECLKNGGVNVDEFMQDVESLSTLELPRSASALSVRTDASGQEQASSDSFYDSDYNDAGSEVTAVEKGAGAGAAAEAAEEDTAIQDAAEVEAMMEAERAKIEQMTAAWDDPTQIDWGHGESPESSPAPSQKTPGPSTTEEATYKCVALYNYTAQNPDELSIVENEQLEVLAGAEYDAGEGWLRARNYRGEEGFVPQNYLDFVDLDADGAPVQRETSELPGQSPLQQEAGISFSSVDYTYSVDEQEGESEPDGLPAQPAPPSQPAPPAPSEEPPQQSRVKDAAPPPLTLQLNGDGPSYCCALYDYEATSSEELTFEEGVVIRVLRRSVHSVDDGWWEGEVQAEDGTTVTGLFPSLVVQDCGPNGEPLTPEGSDSPPCSAPPVFTPPDMPSFLVTPQAVIVTQPTPVSEQPSGQPPGPPPVPPPAPPPTQDSCEAEAMEGEGEGDKDGFSMALNKGQKNQYQSQFSEEEEELAQKADKSQTPAMVVPTVCVELHGEDEVEEDEDGGEDEELTGLGAAAQIVITAATPMTEEPEQPFPPPPEEQEDQTQQDKDKMAEEETESIDTPQEAETDASSSEQPTEIENVEAAEESGEGSVTSLQQINSIPDELELQQLAKLSSLKESDA